MAKEKNPPIHTVGGNGKFFIDIYKVQWVDRKDGSNKVGFKFEVYKPFDSQYGRSKDRKVASWEVSDYKQSIGYAIKLMENFEAQEKGQAPAQGLPIPPMPKGPEREPYAPPVDWGQITTQSVNFDDDDIPF